MMSFEPYQIRQDFGTPVHTGLTERTPEDYQADLVRKFGRLPSWQELARIENKAAKCHLDRLPGESTSSGVDATRARRKDWAAVVAAASPVTRHVAAALWGVFPPAADSRLQSLEAGGFAVRVQGAKLIHWQIIPEGGA
jgi:hypothetical protein